MKSKALFTNNTMKTKPKPTAATSTVRQARKKCHKTAPKTSEQVKTRATPSHPLKTGWIAFEDEMPKEGQLIAVGRFNDQGLFVLSPFLLDWSDLSIIETHWLALPNPPKRKNK